MSLSFKEFNSAYASIKLIVEAEVAEEIKLNEGLFGGIFNSGSKSSSSQSKLVQANQDKKLNTEYSEYIKNNPKASITLQQYKELRSKAKDDAWKAAKFAAKAPIVSVNNTPKSSERAQNARDRGEEYTGDFKYVSK